MLKKLIGRYTIAIWLNEQSGFVQYRKSFFFFGSLRSNLVVMVEKAWYELQQGFLSSEAAKQEKMDSQWHIKNHAGSGDFRKSDPYIKKHRHH